MTQFFHYVLRTTDVAAARAFYSAVLGDTDAEILPLHEQALARGARPHWLGLLDVADVADGASAFAERGAAPLGPKWVNPQGLEAAVMRDPGGAVVALAKPAAAQARVPHPRVAWHLLNTAQVERAMANYSQLFGWEFKPPDPIGQHGVLQPFSFQAGGPVVGALSDVAGRPGVHPHWLFHFHVAALEPALQAVRAAGGLVIGPFTLASGAKVAVCDDAQGAAFALLEPER